MIPYGRQDISQEDVDAVVDVLGSDYLTQGPRVPMFEQALCDSSDARFATVMNSATSALHVACLALDVGPGDEVWTSPITFVASANCALYCGASVGFVDIDPQTGNMSVDALEERLIAAERDGRLPKVVIPVHLGGNPCDMPAIHRLARRYGFSVIEDASHAIGGSYADGRVGSCRYSDITVFSFHPVKIVTTAEGGAALTNSEDLAEKIRLLHTHGITRDEDRMQGPSQGLWYYEQIALGFNYRMTELQAALGLTQLKRLDDFVSARHVLARRYDEMIDPLPVSPLRRNVDCYSGLHLYVIQIDDELGDCRAEVFARLRASGIGVNVHYIPVHTQPFYARLGFSTGDYPAAENYYRRAISLPMYHTLSSEEQDQVVSALRHALP